MISLHDIKILPGDSYCIADVAMWAKFGNSSVPAREAIITLSIWEFDQKNTLSEGWSWFKFNNLGLALGMALKIYITVTKQLKLKVRKFWGLVPTFVDVTGEKLVGAFFASHPE